MKKCNLCLKEKDTKSFHKSKNEKDGLKRTCKQCRLTESETYYKQNKEKINKYRANNKEKLKTYRREYVKERNKIDPVFRTAALVRSVIYSTFVRKGFKKSKRTEKLLGCTLNEFKKYLEDKFKPGMNWENRSKWHIDHITPLATALTIKDVERLCHYTNLQPLWAHENLSKGAKT